MSSWQLRSLDCALVFAQSPAGTGTCLKIPIGLCAQESDGPDASDEHCLNFKTAVEVEVQLKLVHRPSGLEERDFVHSKTDPYLFTRHDCVMITRENDCLVFFRKIEFIIALIVPLEDKFKLSDKSDLASFLGRQFKCLDSSAL